MLPVLLLPTPMTLRSTLNLANFMIYELALEQKCNLRDTVDWDRTYFIWSFKSFWCYLCKNGSVSHWQNKDIFEMLALSFTAILNWQAASIPKIASEKTGPFIYSLTCLASKGRQFGRYTIFSEKLKFLTPGVRNVSFSENFAPVLKPL